MNRAIPLMAEAHRPGFVSPEELKLCKSMSDAIILCIEVGKTKYKTAVLASLLDIDRGQLSKALRGKGYNYPPNKLALLMEVCGNYAPLQYLMQEMGFGKAMELLAA